LSVRGNLYPVMFCINVYSELLISIFNTFRLTEKERTRTYSVRQYTTQLPLNLVSEITTLCA